MTGTEVKFTGGANIAMKLPPHQFDEVVRFYRDVLKIRVLSGEGSDCVTFEFGVIRLSLDRVATVSQAEVWLQVMTPDTKLAAAHLEASGVVRCDAIEALPEGFDGFWIANPAGVVHLVDGQDAP